ncbi:hypothetical protein [Reyranella massiliensis]|uniref:hypothetical protein n=1 Tax=Reyranella massiliensis TaxID=445220 RepID=UPI0002E4E193|nr:hypothetical protein [Reyranella massiliensis]
MAGLGDTCKAAIKEAYGDKLTDAEADRLTQNLTDKAAEMIRSKRAVSDSEALTLATIELAETAKRTAMLEQRERYFNVERKKERDTLRNSDEWKMRPGDAIEAQIWGIEGPQAGAARSTEVLQKGHTERLTTALGTKLRESGMDKAIKTLDRDGDMNVWIEMSRARGGSDPASGNEVATKLGKIYAEAIHASVLRMNDGGAYIRELAGFVVSRSYDRMKVRGAGGEADFQDFMKFWTEPGRLDIGKTFPHIDPSNSTALTQELRELWTSFSTGHHGTGQSNDWLTAFKGGSSNVAKKVGHSRSIQFETAKGEFEIMEKYGTGNVHENVMLALRRAGRTRGILDMWGPAGRAAMRADVEDAKASMLKVLNDPASTDEMRQAATKQIEKLQSRRIEQAFDYIDGTSSIQGTMTGATLLNRARLFGSWTLLNNGILGSLPDIANRAGELKWLGQSFTEGNLKGIGAIFSGAPSAEKRAFAARVVVASDSFTSELLERFDAGSSPDGKWSKRVDLTNTLNGQRYLNDVLKTQSAMDIGVTLGAQKDLARAALDARLRTTFDRYSITDSDWDYVRTHTIKDHNGLDFVVSDAIHQESDAAIRKMMGRENASEAEIRKFKDDFELKWSSMFYDIVRNAATDPNAKTRFHATLGTQAGTPAGEIVRTLTQFMSYPIGAIQHHLGRELYRGGSANVSGMVHLIIATTVYGAIANAALDVIKGKTPFIPEDGGDYVQMFGKAMARGGGLGFFYDKVIADWGRGGGAHLLGPTVGTVADFAKLTQHLKEVWVDDKGHNLGSESLSTISRHTPYVNLFYTKAAWEFVVLNGLMESVNPGYLGRMERRLERENHQQLLLPRSAW